MFIFHNQQYRQFMSSGFSSANSVGQASRARSQQMKKRSDAIARSANSNFRSVMRTLVQKNDREKRFNQANYITTRGKYEVRHNQGLQQPVLSQNQKKLELRNFRGLDLGLLEEPFTRSCTAQHDIHQNLAHPESEYDVTIASQNENSAHKEYLLANAFTNQGLARHSTTTKSVNKTRPGTQQNNPAAVLDAYAGTHWFDLNGSATGNSTSNYNRKESDAAKYVDIHGRFHKKPIHPTELLSTKIKL